MNKENRYSKEELSNDVRKFVTKAKAEDYILLASDIFALGYLCGKYNIERLEDTPELQKAIEEYDKTDDLMLLDTVAETLSDLGVIAPIN